MAVLRTACVFVLYFVQSYLKRFFVRIYKIYCHVPFHILKVSVANVSPTPGVRNPHSCYCLVSEIKSLEVLVISTGVVFI